MAHVGSQDVVRENICLAPLTAPLLQESLRATKLEQNFLAYMSDFKG